MLTAVVAGLAAVPRLTGLTAQSLWFDELFSVHFSRPELAVGEVVAMYAGDFHPLLHPLLLHIWFHLFGWTDLAARLLSGLAGVAGVAAAAVLGRRLAGPPGGLALALVTAVNPFQLQYSHEVRPYALAFFFAALSWAALLELLERPGWRTTALWLLPTALALHTHYFALLMVAAQLVAATTVELAGRRRRHALAWFTASGGGAILALLPWIGPTLRAARVTEYWPAPPTPGFVLDYLADYFGGSSWLGGTAAVLLLALPWLLLQRSGATDERRRREARWAAVVGMACALVLAAAYLRSTLVVPMLMPRFTMVLVPAILALAVLAALRLPGRWTGAVVVAVLTLGSAAQLWHKGWPHWPRKEQWREATAVALARETCAERLLLSEMAPGFQFYAARLAPEVTVVTPGPEVIEAAAGRLGPDDCLWLLIARDRRPIAAAEALLEQYFRLEERVELHRTQAELWRRRPGS